MWVKTQDVWNSLLITTYDFPPNAPDWTIFCGCALFKRGPELLHIPRCGHPWGLAPVHWFSVWFCCDLSRYPSALLAIFLILLYLSCGTSPEGRECGENFSSAGSSQPCLSLWRCPVPCPVFGCVWVVQPQPYPSLITFLKLTHLVSFGQVDKTQP